MTAPARAQRATRTPLFPKAATVSVAPPAPPAPAAAAPVLDQVATDLPQRPARRPFGERRARLDNQPIPGFQCYWFNDLPGRIDQAKEAGYEHVTDNEGRPVKKVVGTMEGGGPLHAYRMKILRAWYEEDQVAKEQPRTEVDQQMRQGGKESGYVQQGRPGYTPSKVSAEMSPDGRQTMGTKS